MKPIRVLFLVLITKINLAQTNTCTQIDTDLVGSYKKLTSLNYGYGDSIDFYSDTFSNKITNYISKNPETIKCPFNGLKENHCSVVTSADGLFRIYSWDTWLGGTMHDFNNIYQFTSNQKTYTKIYDYPEGDYGTYYTDIYTLKANNKTYYLTLRMNSFSTRDHMQAVDICTIEGGSLNDSVALIKSHDSLISSISVEYNFMSVINHPERPLRLIKYDADKKIIYIPIVMENGDVTDRFILYQFKGKYFECIEIQKPKKPKK
ncbi:MAG: hypothetical protein ACHQII_02595 [Bacteroidia bacterium]